MRRMGNVLAMLAAALIIQILINEPQFAGTVAVPVEYVAIPSMEEQETTQQEPKESKPEPEPVPNSQPVVIPDPVPLAEEPKAKESVQASPSPEMQEIETTEIVYEKVCYGTTCRLVPRIVKKVVKVAKAAVNVAGSVPKAIVNGVQTARLQATCPDCPTCPENANGVLAAPRVFAGGNGRNWHYRGSGSLASHVEREHGIDCSGLSQAEVQAIHNACHEGAATVSHRLTVQPVRSFVRAQPVRGFVRGVGCRLFPGRCN